MHQPYLLVNVFGGNLKTLARRLCGLSPSFFLYNNKDLTKKLIILSRQELVIPLPRHSIPSTEWGKKMKHFSYDNDFYQFTDLQMERMDSLITCIEYDTIKEGYISSIQEEITQLCSTDDLKSIAFSIKSSDSRSKNSRRSTRSRKSSTSSKKSYG